MSVSTATESPFAYMDRMIEGGMPHSYAPTAKTEDIAASTENTEKDEGFSLFGKDGFGFDDFLDIINPLQHIPVVSTIYREITGDELEAGARLIGGGIFGGGIGLASSAVNTFIEAQTGKDIGEHVASVFSGETASDEVQVAKVQETTPITSDKTAPIAAATTTQTEPAPIAQKATADQLAAAQMMAAAMRSGSMPSANGTQQAAKPEMTSVSDKPAPSTDPAAPPLGMGLEWKTQPPNLRKTIDKIQSQHGLDLSSNQISQLVNSMGKASGLTPTAQSGDPSPAAKAPELVSDATPVIREKATGAYDKGIDLAARHSATVDPYAYMNPPAR